MIQQKLEFNKESNEIPNENLSSTFVVDKVREERQLIALNRWIKKGNGVLQWATGTGKTYIGILAIKKLNINKPDYTINVVVPSTKLKEDWVGNKTKLGHIQKHNLKNVKVYVINTYVNNIKKFGSINCDFLLVDEVHRTGATSFSLTLEKTNRRFFMGLTATLERLDGRHEIIMSKGGGIVDILTDTEAKKLGFISDYLIFNLGIDISEESKKLYNFYNSKFREKFLYFNNDFSLAMACSMKNSPRYINNKWEHSEAVKFAILNGYLCDDLNLIINRFNRNKQIKEENKGKKRKDKVRLLKLYENDNLHAYHPDKVYLNGVLFRHYMQLRKDFVYKLKEKLPYLKELVDIFPDKQIITFSESANYADSIVELLGEDKCKAYHTKLKTKEKNSNISEFEKGNIKILSTVKALNEGFDVPNVEITVNLSQTRSKTAAIQKRGRANRKDYNNENKLAIHVNIFINDFYYEGQFITSSERKTIVDNQRGQSPIFVTSISQIKEIVEERLGNKDENYNLIMD